MKGLAGNFAKLFFKGKEKSGKFKENKQKPDETCEIVDRDDQNAVSTAAEGIMQSDDPPNELKNRGKLFVGGLCYQTTSKGLETYFSQFGKVIDAVVLRHPDSGRSRGFGFVTFADVSDAESAASADSHLLDGKNIDVRPFVSGKPNSKTSKKEHDFRVFLGGLPENVSTDLLKNFFGRYGEVNQVIIPLDKNTKKPKGFGFMSFKSEDAVEKCLAEGFVHLCGRRIHIKRAKPRSSSHSRDEVEMAEDCLESDTLSGEDLTPWDEMSTSSIVDNETSSTSSGERSENFLLPTWALFNSMYGKKTREEEQNLKELLSDFIISSNIECWASDENLISFSDDSDSEESNTHPYCASDASENDYEADAENEAKLIHHLKNELMKVLKDDDPSVGGGDCGDVQKSSPMKFRDNNGSLFCPLCQWAPEDNSCESFLDHCRTAFHRNQLKDRFPREQSQIGRPTEESKSKEKTDSKQKPSAQKPTVQQGISKSQEKIQIQGNGEKQNQAQQQQQQQQQQQKAKNTGAKAAEKGGNGDSKHAASNSKPEEYENKKMKKNNVKGLKVMALAKGMSCLQPASNGHLKCSMCKKMIPQSDDFNIVMKNVSMHLQSKGHLKKLLETENLLKVSLEKNQGETKSSKSAKNPPSLKAQDKIAPQEQKNPKQKVQTKAPSREQKAPNQKPQDKASAQKQVVPNLKPQDKASAQKQVVPNLKPQDKASAQKQVVPNLKPQDKASAQKHKNVTKDTGTTKSQDKNSSSKLCFLCVPCNYLNTNIDLFKVHLKSESHLDCFITRGVNTDLSFDNLSKCKSCEMFLYGSLYYINKHYSKCSGKKT